MKKLLLTAILGCLLKTAIAQEVSFIAPIDSTYSVKKDQINHLSTSRKWLAGGLAVAGMGGSLFYLAHSNNFKYAGNFKTINDVDY